jgi:hypothetical protein
MLRVVIAIFGLTSMAPAASTNVKDMVLEYRPNANGALVAVIHNHHAAAATAYVAEAYFDSGAGGHEQRTAFGGDALGHLDGGGIEVHPGDQNMGYSLPGGANPTSTGFSAAIYADGYTEGNEDIVSMLLSGRAQSYADLKQLIPELEKLDHHQITQDDVIKMLERMAAKDKAEGKDLDSMVARSGLRYQFFVGAVPAQAMEKLQAGAGTAIAPEFRAWLKRLEESKPSLK